MPPQPTLQTPRLILRPFVMADGPVVERLAGAGEVADDDELLHEEVTHSITGSAFDVHRDLGFGFREYVSMRALERDLIRKGHKAEREVWVTIYFRGDVLSRERMDRLVDDKVLVEGKGGSESRVFVFLGWRELNGDARKQGRRVPATTLTSFGFAHGLFQSPCFRSSPFHPPIRK
jgi:hypothetical protein